MFKNTNPVFSKVSRDTSDQAISYGASYQGVILKTGLLFLLIVASAFGSFFLLANYPAVYILGLIVSLVVAFISVFVASISPRLAMPFSILYALAEGFVLGFIVLIYTAAFPNDNIAGLAILITLGIF
ncbi:MAG: Bax inhibitor-1/YccA family membrane protein, partial [Acholeplasmatales bacterium]